MPAVAQALGASFAAGGPPEDEWFEVRHLLEPASHPRAGAGSAEA